jgi:hypothetical protein
MGKRSDEQGLIERVSGAVTQWTGSTTAFASAVGVIVVGCLGAGVRLLRHVAARD